MNLDDEYAERAAEVARRRHEQRRQDDAARRAQRQAPIVRREELAQQADQLAVALGARRGGRKGRRP